MRIVILITAFTCCFLRSEAQYGFDTVKIYYDIGVSELDRDNKTTLDSLAKSFNEHPRGIMIYGYADYLGKKDPNQQLSEDRADGVKYHLMQKGVTREWLLAVDGIGQVKEKCRSCESGNREYRITKVLIKRLHPDTTSGNVSTDTGDINIAAMDTGATFVLKNINFYENSHQVLPQSISALGQLYQIMRDNPKLKIRLEGHICCVTDFPDATDFETGRLDLSMQRAKYIRDYLVKKGIAPERLQYKGFGRTKPIYYSEDNEQQREANRRVEVRILEK